MHEMMPLRSSQSGGRGFDPPAVHQLRGRAVLRGPAKVPALGLLILGLASAAAAQPTTILITGQASIPDAQGRYTVKLEIPDQPVTVAKGDTWEGVYVYRLPGDVTIRRVRTFLGVDRLNVWEGHVLVLAEDMWLVTRGPHKETAYASYDAWESEQTEYRVPPEGADLYVFGLGHSTVNGKGMKLELGVILDLVP